MRKLIVEEWLTLDGYAADRNDRTDFFPSTEANKASDRDQLAFLETVDLILLGRRTYELFVDFWPAATSEKEIIADRLNAIPKVVFSNTLEKAPWGNWAPAQVVKGDAVAEVRRLRQQQGESMVLWGSLSLAQDLMVADLIDEYHIQVCPTVLGGGRRFFTDLTSERQLEFVSSRSYDTGVVFTQYRRGSESSG